MCCTDIVSFVGRKTSDCLVDETSDGKLFPQSVQRWCKVLPPLNRLTSSTSFSFSKSPALKPTRLQSDDTERGAPANGRNRIRDIKYIGACLEPIHRVRLCAEEEVRFTCVMFKTRTVKKPFSLGSGREVGELAPRCLLVFSPDVSGEDR